MVRKMDKKHRMVLGLIAFTVVGLMMMGMFAAGNAGSYKTLAFNDTGTTLEVPESMELKMQLDEDGILSETYSTSDGNVQIQRRAVHNPYVAQILNWASDSDGPSVKAANCSRIIKNESTGETILIASMNGDSGAVDHIAKSVKWGKKTVGAAKFNSAASGASSDSSSGGGADKTYPFYSDTGELLGYYTVGDTVNFKDYVFKLQPNGEWIMIGEAIGSGELGFKAGYQSALDDIKYNETQQAETDSGSDGGNDSSSPSPDVNSSDV